MRSKSKFVLLTVTLYKVNPFKLNIVTYSCLLQDQTTEIYIS